MSDLEDDFEYDIDLSDDNDTDDDKQDDDIAGADEADKQDNTEIYDVNNDLDDLADDIEQIQLIDREVPDIYKNKHNKTIIVIKPENRITSHILSKFEMTNIVSSRASDIETHNNCMVDIIGLDDPISQAKRELMMRKCPYMVRRYIGDRIINGELVEHYEDWDPNKMVFAVQYNNVI